MVENESKKYLIFDDKTIEIIFLMFLAATVDLLSTGFEKLDFRMHKPRTTSCGWRGNKSNR